ncbi:hypothetical protein FRC09_013602 [Ceratobasidium sp. 395]|nr:hypothetical protein FRC09_013602 [Ceratobasidium sp. 395]
MSTERPKRVVRIPKNAQEYIKGNFTLLANASQPLEGSHTKGNKTSTQTTSTRRKPASIKSSKSKKRPSSNQLSNSQPAKKRARQVLSDDDADDDVDGGMNSDEGLDDEPADGDEEGGDGGEGADDDILLNTPYPDLVSERYRVRWLLLNLKRREGKDFGPLDLPRAALEACWNSRLPPTEFKVKSDNEGQADDDDNNPDSDDHHHDTRPQSKTAGPSNVASVGLPNIPPNGATVSQPAEKHTSNSESGFKGFRFAGYTPVPQTKHWSKWASQPTQQRTTKTVKSKGKERAHSLQFRHYSPPVPPTQGPSHQQSSPAPIPEILSPAPERQQEQDEDLEGNRQPSPAPRGHQKPAPAQRRLLPARPLPTLPHIPSGALQRARRQHVIPAALQPLLQQGNQRGNSPGSNNEPNNGQRRGGSEEAEEVQQRERNHGGRGEEEGQGGGEDDGEGNGEDDEDEEEDGASGETLRDRAQLRRFGEARPVVLLAAEKIRLRAITEHPYADLVEAITEPDEDGLVYSAGTLYDVWLAKAWNDANTEVRPNEQPFVLHEEYRVYIRRKFTQLRNTIKSKALPMVEGTYQLGMNIYKTPKQLCKKVDNLLDDGFHSPNHKYPDRYMYCHPIIGLSICANHFDNKRNSLGYKYPNEFWRKGKGIPLPCVALHLTMLQFCISLYRDGQKHIRHLKAEEQVEYYDYYLKGLKHALKHTPKRINGMQREVFDISYHPGPGPTMKRKSIRGRVYEPDSEDEFISTRFAGPDDEMDEPGDVSSEDESEEEEEEE